MEKIKSFLESEKGKSVLIAMIIILVGFGSFELGRLSKGGSNGGIKIEYPLDYMSQSASIINASSNPENSTEEKRMTSQINKNTNTTQKIYFASNRGRKYYPLGCSAGKTIKQENRVFFATKEEAEKAGYELSSSCQ